MTEPDNKASEAVTANRTVTIALHYSGRGAPRIVGKGSGLIAEHIIATARAHGIPLDEDPALTSALTRVELSREIPHELYIAVAQLLAFAWQIGKSR